ncbi:hypothetical protein [Clostridium aquiflavi]|uniref:Uncharacterized protein n=1 Tax=Clostridium aquiflavi TaxID=3073603 RepID=A0ABU1EJZ2_9CLOT|nr:hypothetical protein [Clostridium sp. 5N-1]MDR5588705.1 hypothetical protein [Clostridium sp. 5N-1]
MNLKKSLRYDIEIITKCGIKFPGRSVDSLKMKLTQEYWYEIWRSSTGKEID